MSERAAHRTRERALSGGGSVAARPEITASWRRVRAGGLAPGAEPSVAPLSADDIEVRRTTSALAPLLPVLRSCLAPVVDDGHLVVICDADGRVLWRDGLGGVRRLADGLGFVGGSAWTEANVGTNAIGTCLVEGSPVHVAGPEHYVESHMRWSCAAAPVHDPTTGEVIGAVDVSGPAASVRPSMVALVDATARLAALEVRRDRTAALDRLRAHAAPLLARLGGRALAVDGAGRVAAVTGGAVGTDRLVLPRGAGGSGPVAGPTWLPTLGRAVLEPLPGGWLVRLADDPEVEDAEPATLRLHRSGGRARLSVSTVSHSWDHAPSPRHTQILELLLAHPGGRSAAQLAEALFGDPTRVGTVRAEMSRLRRALGPIVETRPYRLSGHVRAVDGPRSGRRGEEVADVEGST